MDDDFRFSLVDRTAMAKALGAHRGLIGKIEQVVGTFRARHGDDAAAPNAETMRHDIKRVRDAVTDTMAALEQMHDECAHYLEVSATGPLYSRLYDVRFNAEHFLSRKFKRGAKVQRSRHDLEDEIAVLLHEAGVSTRGPKFEAVLRITVKAAIGRGPMNIKDCAAHARKAIKRSRRSLADFS